MQFHHSDAVHPEIYHDCTYVHIYTVLWKQISICVLMIMLVNYVCSYAQIDKNKCNAYIVVYVCMQYALWN